MLITLRLTATPQGPVHDEPARSFAEDSVTVGRAPNCSVVLPDGLRLISRQHVRLVRQGAEVLLGCLSASAPVRVNHVDVPHGGVLPVRSGDVIHIGGFELCVTLQATAARPLPGAVVLPAEASPAPVASGSSMARPATAPAIAPAMTPSIAPSLAPSIAPARRGRARLDEWFDLTPEADAPVNEAAAPVAWAETAEVDLDLRSGAQTPAPASTEQRVLESLQQVLQPPAPPPGPDLADAPAPSTPVETAGALPEQPRVPIVRPDAVPGDVQVEVPAPPPAVALVPTSQLDDEGRAQLMVAFMEGAGLGSRAGTTNTQMVAPMALTPQWMRHIGALLRASVEGSLALLHSRSTVKREMRAEVTVIARRQNNPLKFAPDAQAALAHLLAAKRSPGFLEPVAALKDAHEDLLVHHFAVVAGMRAAMFELIARLGPDDVLREEGPPKGLSTLPTLHEAALWRRYRQRHAEMTARLDDDFETVFGREFTKAYEAQARRVRDKVPPEDTGTGG